MMGLHGDGQVLADDFYNTSSYSTKEEMKYAVNKEIQNTLNELGVTGLINHELRKIGVTWADGANGSVYIRNYRSKPNKLSVYNYTVGNRRDFLNIYSQAYYCCLLLFAVKYLLSKIKPTTDFYFVTELSLLGGIIFYMIWEAKNVYSIPFLSFIIIMAGNYLSTTSCLVSVTSDYRKKILRIGIILVSLTNLLFWGGYKRYTQDEYQTTNRLISGEFNGFIYSDKISDIASSNKTISQSFIVNSPFDQIQVNASLSDVCFITKHKYSINNVSDLFETYIRLLKEINNTKYKFELYDEQHNLLYNHIFTVKNIRNGMLSFNFGAIVPSANYTEYTLKIFKVSGEKDSISWHYLKAIALDQYDGDGFVNNKKTNDLNIRVLKKTNNSYTTPKWFIIIWLSCIFIQLIGIRLIVKKGFKKTINEPIDPEIY